MKAGYIKMADNVCHIQNKNKETPASLCSFIYPEYKINIKAM